jgi:ribosome production factor 2
MKPAAKTAKGKRILESREPQLVEPPKSAVFVKTTSANQLVSDVLHSLNALKKPLGHILAKKNDIHPFEFGKNTQAIEFLMEKNEASLMVLGSHSKKRPQNLTFIRSFDRHLYDIYELQVVDFKSIQQVASTMTDAWVPGSKPAFLFSGDEFELNEEYKNIKLLLLDFFRGQVVKSIDVLGIQTVINVIACQGKILFRVYRIKLLKNSDTPTVPKVELEPVGPFIDFVPGRQHLASADLKKQAHAIPRELKPKKVKNVSHDGIGDKYGRIHVGRQQIDKLQTRKVKALRAPKKK